MGSAKSKPAGDENSEENSSSSTKSKSFTSINNSGSNNSIGDEYLVINNTDSSTSTKSSGDNLNKKTNLNPGKSSEGLDNQQSKIRPHSLFDESNTDFKLIDTTLPEIQDSEKYTKSQVKLFIFY